MADILQTTLDDIVEWKVLHFDQMFTEFCSLGSNRQ